MNREERKRKNIYKLVIWSIFILSLEFTAYGAGYRVGHQMGLDSGYSNGYADGYEDGNAYKYEEGYYTGYQEAMLNEYADAFGDGVQMGYREFVLIYHKGIPEELREEYFERLEKILENPNQLDVWNYIFESNECVIEPYCSDVLQ